MKQAIYEWNGHKIEVWENEDNKCQWHAKMVTPIPGALHKEVVITAGTIRPGEPTFYVDDANASERNGKLGGNTTASGAIDTAAWVLAKVDRSREELCKEMDKWIEERQ